MIIDRDSAAKFQSDATKQAADAAKSSDIDFGSVDVVISVASTVTFKLSKQLIEFKCVDDNGVVVFAGSTKALRTACKEITDKLNSEHNLRTIKQWKITAATLVRDDESTYHYDVNVT